jgi:hypothetical protein
MQAMQGHGGGGKHGGGHGAGGMGGGGHGGMHGKTMPGVVQQKCHPVGDQPPHYCEPAYVVMTSVKGIRVSNVAPLGDTEVLVTIRELNPLSPGVAQKLFVFAGTGTLAGGTLVAGGWQKSTDVRVSMEGQDSIYNHGSMHVNVFPVTGE